MAPPPVPPMAGDPPLTSETEQQGIFRRAALDRLDVAVRIDGQLPLVPRRLWLIVLGCLVLMAAGLMWAALTPSQTSITGVGRILAPGGLIIVSASDAGSIGSTPPIMGLHVDSGDELLQINTTQGPIKAITMGSGEVWQDLVAAGEGVVRGQTLITIVPDNSELTAVVVVPEERASALAIGQEAYVQAGDVIPGVVASIQAPLPPELVGPRVGLDLPSGGYYVIVTIALDAPAKPGRQVSARVILDNESVLGRLIP